MSPGVLNYVKNVPQAAEDVPETVYTASVKKWQESYTNINSMNGNESPYALHREMAEEMISNVLIVRGISYRQWECSLPL